MLRTSFTTDVGSSSEALSVEDGTIPDGEGGALVTRRGRPRVELWGRGALRARDNRCVASDLHVELGHPGERGGGRPHGGCFEDVGEHFGGIGVLVVRKVGLWMGFAGLRTFSIHVGLPEMVANVVCAGQQMLLTV